jgi:xylulokinase
MYTKSWSAFDRLVAIVPPGGSIGLDDKLFSFWLLQGDSYPFSHVKGIFRFETGIKVNEFRDLRANPRCLLESQLISFRVKWSRMLATGVLGTTKSRGGVSTQTQPTTPNLGRPTNVLSSLGLPFNPYDHSPLPSRVIATGAAANFPSVANLVGDVLNAPVFVPTTQVDSAQVVPHRNAPAQGFPGRATLGSAYVARWVWGRERSNVSGGRGLGGFEEEIRRLMGKRWVATGGVQLKTNINGLAPTLASIGAGGTNSGANSGTSTPFGHPRLGSSVVVEEDEDEYENGQTAQGLGVNFNLGERFGHADIPRIRTQTESTADTLGSSGSGPLPSTAYTTPDLSLSLGGNLSPGANGNGSTVQTPTTPTPLTPNVMLPTGDAEAQIGLAKVAEPDLDAFMAYGSIVPEYCRLETMLVKALV